MESYQIGILWLAAMKLLLLMTKLWRFFFFFIIIVYVPSESRVAIQPPSYAHTRTRKKRPSWKFETKKPPVYHNTMYTVDVHDSNIILVKISKLNYSFWTPPKTEKRNTWPGDRPLQGLDDYSVTRSIGQ